MQKQGRNVNAKYNIVHIIDTMTVYCVQVAWNHVTMDVTQPDMSEAGTEAGETTSEPPLAIQYKSPITFLHTGTQLMN